MYVCYSNASIDFTGFLLGNAFKTENIRLFILDEKLHI